MDGWIDGLMDVWIDGWRHAKEKNEWMNECRQLSIAQTKPNKHEQLLRLVKINYTLWLVHIRLLKIFPDTFTAYHNVRSTVSVSLNASLELFEIIWPLSNHQVSLDTFRELIPHFAPYVPTNLCYNSWWNTRQAILHPWTEGCCLDIHASEWRKTLSVAFENS